MYLFGTSADKRVEIFELVPNEKEILRYKQDELERIPKEERFCKHITNIKGRKLASEDGIELCPHTKRNKKIEGLDYNDMFDYEEYTDAREGLRRLYVDQDYESFEYPRLFRIIGVDKNNQHVRNAYMFTTEDYRESYRNAEMGNIILLPRTLYLINLLETGQLKLLQGEDCSKELSFFDLNHVNSVEWDAIEKLEKYGLFDGATYKTSELVSSSAHLLKLKNAK